MTSHQAHKTHYFRSRLEDLVKNNAYAGWLKEVFTLRHLPGRVFAIGSAQIIPAVLHLVGIRSQPVHIPRAEWGGGVDSATFLPWIRHDIPPCSWVRISKGGLRYAGDLAYVVGSANTTDAMLIAIVPRIRQLPQEDKMIARKGSKTAMHKGKRPQKVGGWKTTRLPPKLFEPDTMSVRFGQMAVGALPFTDTAGFKSIFVDKYANQVVSRGPNTDDSPVALDLDDFHWANILISGENIYSFDGQLFYRGLLILPIYSYAVVEKVTVPAVDEVVTFAESGIDPVRINRLLSQLHWQVGDHVSRADELYKVEDIQMDLESVSVSASKVQHPTAEGVAISISLPMKELRRKFFSGDGVIVVAGSHKGLTGSVLRERDGILHVLTDDFGNSVSKVNCSVFFIANLV